ncbi:MAG TPA: carotenoid oxygenase family protein, partial [Gammaproteobacteria bacterium]|nr:carotenoid oxygenase family protein [Gammaproteobacteria bacterium]
AGAVGTAGGVDALAAAEAEAQELEPTARRVAARSRPAQEDIPPSMRHPASLYRVQAEVVDCEVEGKLPLDLNGAFYRVGPDAQYPLYPGNIPFDGEGHVSMFRIRNGRVDYLSRYVKNERWLAQDKAGRQLFRMYRNPMMDDPSVEGLSRSTANTHIINHRHMLLALKEDSPPAAMDLLTLETLAPNYTFDGKLPSKTFTAHPKIDSVTGNMVAFGYEAAGFGSDVVSMFEFTPDGKLVWNASIHAPYVGMLHDFAVTEKHIVFYVIPLAFDKAQLEHGGVHWSWDSKKPTYFGFVRRGGDGKDIQWIEGPTRSATHVMGSFEDGDKLFVDVEMSLSNPFPFMPMRNGETWDPIAGSSHITRLSVDLSKKRPAAYGIETLYPGHVGALPRQDDRYNTVAYRYGFLPCPDPEAADRRRAGACYARFDHQTRSATLFNAGPETSLAECCFAPKSADAPEARGYLLGVATRNNENGRADLLILDAEHLADGPLATVKLPIRAPGQIHGYWVPEEKLPTKT